MLNFTFSTFVIVCNARGLNEALRFLWTFRFAPYLRYSFQEWVFYISTLIDTHIKVYQLENRPRWDALLLGAVALSQEPWGNPADELQQRWSLIRWLYAYIVQFVVHNHRAVSQAVSRKRGSTRTLKGINLTQKAGGLGIWTLDIPSTSKETLADFWIFSNWK